MKQTHGSTILETSTRRTRACDEETSRSNIARSNACEMIILCEDENVSKMLKHLFTHHGLKFKELMCS